MAIAGDVIDCDLLLSPEKAWFYSNVVATEVNSDEENDNEEGFQIDFFSIEKSRLKYHNITEVPKPPFVRSLNKSSNSRFIIPYDYYNRPWYMRKNSNITLNFDFQDHFQLPTKAVAYIINHQQNIDDFTDNPASTPYYEQKIDILGSLRRTLTVTINNSGYHYVGVEISSDVNVDFMFNVSFNFLYIDKDDYDLQSTNLRQIERIGQSQSLPLDDEGRNLTLCYPYNRPNEIGSSSIHLNIIYKLAGRAKALGITIIVTFFVFISSIIFLYCIISKVRSRNRHVYVRLAKGV